MNLNKGTRYALYAAMELARAHPGGQVTVARVAERYRLPGAVLAKVFQQLVAAGIALGTRGSGGGYQLARDPKAVTVLDVVETFEPAAPAGECLLADVAIRPCAAPGACDLHRVFREVDELVRGTLASITLKTLVRRRAPGVSGRGGTRS